MTFRTEIVFVRLLFPLILGILFGYAIDSSTLLIPVICIAILILTLLILQNIYFNKISAYNFSYLYGINIHILFILIGIIICINYNQQFKSNYYAKQNFEQLKIIINNEPQLSNDILRFEAKVIAGYKNQKSEAVSGQLMIALKIDPQNPKQLFYGDELIITGKYLPIEEPYNPGEFNYRGWLATKNIYQQTFINQDQMIRIAKDQGNPILNYAIQLRKQQVEFYKKHIKDQEAFAVASTLVLGYRADLSKETLASYSKTGTIHALSVSGAHVGIIFFLLNYLLFFLDRRLITKLIKLFIICALIWYYALLTGLSSAALRAAIMITVFIVSKAINRSANNYNILAFAAFILLLYNPFFICDVGFQLSFIAVFGLIYLQPIIYNWLDVKNKWLDKIWGAVALSLAAQLVTFPLSIYYFHQFPLYFLLGNLFILIPLIAMMYLGIIILIFKITFLVPIFEWLISFTNYGLKWIANLPYASINAIWLNTTQLLVLCISLIILVYALVNYKKKLLYIALSLMLIFLTISSYQAIIFQEQKKIIFFSLRKNYATAFIWRNETILLTDLTLADKNYQFFIQPALDQLQQKKVDIITWQTDTITANFQKQNNQLRFFDYKLLFVDKQLDDGKIANLPSYNAIYLHKNTKKNISNLRNEVIFKSVIIDATNYDYQIKKYEEEAKKYQINYHTLKKNKAYLIEIK